MISRLLLAFPDMPRYIAQARIGRGMCWDAEQRRCVERDGVAVIEIAGENPNES